MHIKRTIRTWSDKFKNLFFKSTNRFRFYEVNVFIFLYKKLTGVAQRK